MPGEQPAKNARATKVQVALRARVGQLPASDVGSFLGADFKNIPLNITISRLLFGHNDAAGQYELWKLTISDFINQLFSANIAACVARAKPPASSPTGAPSVFVYFYFQYIS
jgi:hypothetical protein